MVGTSGSGETVHAGSSMSLFYPTPRKSPSDTHPRVEPNILHGQVLTQ
jgi:hypothetical protein